MIYEDLARWQINAARSALASALSSSEILAPTAIGTRITLSPRFRVPLSMAKLLIRYV